jgi:hypothetical protein
MNRYLRVGGRLAAIIAFMLLPVIANAQAVGPATSSVSLSLAVSESISITPSVGSVAFGTYSAGAATAPPFSIVVSGNLASGHAMLEAFAWLSSASNALGPIPSSAIFADFGSGPSACNGTATLDGGGAVVGVSGAACQDAAATSTEFHAVGTNGNVILFTANPAAGAFSDTLTTNLSISGGPAVPAGSYSGTLNLEAVVF